LFNARFLTAGLLKANLFKTSFFKTHFFKATPSKSDRLKIDFRKTAPIKTSLRHGLLAFTLLTAAVPAWCAKEAPAAATPKPSISIPPMRRL